MKATALVVYRERSEAQPYADALELAGVQPLLAEARHGLTISECAGLLLTGGPDVNPALYGENAAQQTDRADEERDAVEAELIDEALTRNVPLLAICRGMQILNVHLGGSLIQHLTGVARHCQRPDDRSRPAHWVAIEPGTQLATIAGRDTWHVNSRHHQAVAQLGAGLQICARDSEDGTVEAIELPGRRYMLAVQWHPENQAPVDAGQRKLFDSFADAL